MYDQIREDILFILLYTVVTVMATMASIYLLLRRGNAFAAYINALRIQHFVNLCHEKAATHQPLSVLQLALESGFRSYSTFNTAFKQSMGTTATEWLRNLDSRY